MSDKTGKITEKLGQWTNDRETEARGRAEQKHSDADPGLPDPDDPAVEQEKEQVRREHGDVSR
jgi:uncharacterized protein YjbJ (UPF0337 family)